MNTLITGGTGFIGSRLALRCLQCNDGVRVLGQENAASEAENARLLEGAGVEVVRGSVTDSDLLAKVVEDVDVVFHLAAKQHEMNISDEVFWSVNVRGTQNLLEACANAGVGRFVHGSTIGVYGNARGRLDETSAPNPDNIYGVSKLAGEGAVLESLDNLPAVIIRIPETYGPGDRRLLKLFRMVARGRFPIIGGGTNLHHLVFIDDLTKALLAAAEKQEAVGQTILVAGPRPVTTLEMVRAVAAAVDTKPRTPRLPLWPFALLAAAMESTLRPLGVQPPLHRRRLDFFRKSFELSIEKASAILAFEPEVSFAQGARLTAAWYLNQGIL